MTKPDALGVLDLAGSVASGAMHADEADRQAQSRFRPIDEHRVAQAVLERRELTMAIGAVRAHAAATRAAASFDLTSATRSDPAASEPMSAPTLPVQRAGIAGRDGRRRHTTLLIAAAIVVGTATIGVAVGAGGRVTPAPSAAVPAADESAALSSEDANFRADYYGAGLLTTWSLTASSAQVAWADPGMALVRTADGGHRWTESRPPFLAPAAATAFVDADTVIIGSSGPDIRIALTRDGGATWATDAFVDAAVVYPPILTFRDAASGYALFGTADARIAHIYSTSDGGSTWTGPVRSQLPGGLEMIGGMFGPETGILWSSDGQSFDDRLMLSIDGGATWLDRRFPVDAAAPAGTPKRVETAWTDRAGRWVIAVVVDDASESIFTSDDDARSWDLAGTWPHPYSVRLLSATSWVGTASDLEAIHTWSTHDAGASWRTEVGPAHLYLDLTSIVSTDVIWGYHACSDVAAPRFPGPDPLCAEPALRTVLFVTSDGGRTWTEVTR